MALKSFKLTKAGLGLGWTSRASVLLKVVAGIELFNSILGPEGLLTHLPNTIMYYPDLELPPVAPFIGAICSTLVFLAEGRKSTKMLYPWMIYLGYRLIADMTWLFAKLRGGPTYGSWFIAEATVIEPLCLVCYNLFECWVSVVHFEGFETLKTRDKLPDHNLEEKAKKDELHKTLVQQV